MILSFVAGLGCLHNGTLFAEGSAMDTSSLCEYCYCIKGKQRCVSPQCLLALPGCKPIYSKHSCCPAKYNCSLSSNIFFIFFLIVNIKIYGVYFYHCLMNQILFWYVIYLHMWLFNMWWSDHHLGLTWSGLRYHCFHYSLHPLCIYWLQEHTIFFHLFLAFQTVWYGTLFSLLHHDLNFSPISLLHMYP